MISIYGTVATWRRRWYARHSSRRKRLSRPVVSVGNLCVGGAGKTPTVEYLARLLLARGLRPSILSRGYARRDVAPGVTVVSDSSRVIAGLDAAGDEPLMLARALPGVPVLVGADRFLSGTFAEREFGVGVHILDDGFQHVQLERDVDLLLVSEDDLADRVLPAGRLREPLANAAAADALLVTAGYAAAAERVGRALNVATRFFVTRTIGPPTMVATGDSVVVPTDDPVFAVAGIARPERFFSDIASAGWRVAGTLAFKDHHRFDAHDVDRIREEAEACRASIVLTTEKDRVRLAVCDLKGLPLASVPLTVAIDPADTFATWLMGADFVIDWFVYMAVRALIAVVSVMPESGVERMGTMLGSAFYFLDRAHRRVAEGNVAAAFPARSESERRQIVRAAFSHFGRLLFALLKFSTLTNDELLSRVEFEGEERVRAAYAHGKGVLFVTGHFGFWELQAMVHALRLQPMAVLARALDNHRLNTLLEEIRTRNGNTVIYRQGTIRRAMRLLLAGEGVGILIDQHIMSRDAIYVDFFGRPAATTSAVAALALRTGARVVPLFALPLGNGRYKMIYEHAVEPPGADVTDQVHEFTQRCTDVLEMYVRRHPDLWLWMHRRWRDTPATTTKDMFPRVENDSEDAGR